MYKVIGIITTKNRFDLFKIAVNSAYNQIFPLEELLIVSDSNEEVYLREKEFLKNFKVTLIRNLNSKNYSGSLNTAMSYILKKYYINDNDNQLDKIYIALLDDDDYWHVEYIQECAKSLNNETDFVISGINYMLEDKTIKLSIPSNLSIRDFLIGNPHLQGSNTFVKFKSLLNIGTFDESMNSTIDRDMFIRMILLNSKYSVVDKHLVFVNAYHNQDRVTVDPSRKIQGLKKFYRKYNFLMDDSDKVLFFERIEKLLKIKIEKFEEKSFVFDNTYKEDVFNSKENVILIGFIATDYEAAVRLTEEIVNLNRKKIRVLVIINGLYDYQSIFDNLSSSNIEFKLITLDEIKKLNHDNQYGPFISDYVIEDKIAYISLARRILHYHLYEYVKENEVIWILDEDVSLKQETIVDNQIQTTKIPIDYIINKYRDSFDVGVGNITNDPAIPALSTLRTNLIDFYYNLNKKENLGSIISKDLYDYYYDYSDSTNQYLEQPFNIEVKVELKDAFQGKAISRKLILFDDEVKEASNHGGNTLIFNKEVLKVPNLSLKIDNQYIRRGDFFWILCCKNKGYRIMNLPFAVNHNRNTFEFDYPKEINKLIRDLFGSSLTKAYKVYQNTNDAELRNEYIEQVIKRLSKIILSFFRIQSLLKLIDEGNEFKQYFTDEKIREFKDSIVDSLQVDKLKSSFTQLSRYISIYDRLSYEEKEIKLIKEHFNTDNIRLLGYGSEANVFTDEKSVFKVFHKVLTNLNLFNNDVFNKISSLYPIDIHKINPLTIFNYTYETSTEYDGGHADELIQFLRDFKDNNLVFTNINARNFRVNKNNQLKLIDYGDAIKEWNDEDFERMILRTYQLLRYNHISVIEFKTLINMSYKGLDYNFTYGFERFKKIINQRSKEEIHDNIIIDKIKSYNVKTILDYGAGKCKIANKLSNDYKLSVFDIDTETLESRANKNIEVIHDIQNHEKKYDLINTNLVLCAVEDDVAESIIKNIQSLISDSGILVLSICNPFYNDVPNTELRIESRVEDYEIKSKFIKENRIYHSLRDEYNRPFNFYQHLLIKHGFEIVDVDETEGYNLKSLSQIGEHLILVCKYKGEKKKNGICNHAMIIYVDNNSTSIIHQQFHSLTKNIPLDSDIIIIFDDFDIKNKEYCELLFTKSNKIKGEVTFLVNKQILGYEESIKKIFKERVEFNAKYKSCTILRTDYIFNEVDGFNQIQSSLEEKDLIVHNAFNEYNPFNNYNIHEDNADYLPVSWNLNKKVKLVDILRKYKYQSEEKYLYRKARKD
jgi:hypothetical protein